MKRQTLFLSLAVLLVAGVAAAQNKRDTQVRQDKLKLANDDSWFYDDLDKALGVARQTKRPLMVVFR